MYQTCSRCSKLRPIDEFHWKQQAKGVKQKHCKFCAREHSNNWYKRNKLTHIKNVRANNRQAITNVRDYISGLNLACKECGENHQAVLDFHHVNSKTKEFAVSVMIIKGFSLVRIKKEINKCIVLCSNCHRKLHWNEKQKEFIP